MTDRPISYTGPMVRALLAGTKTQTRRVLKFGSEPPVWSGPGLPTNDPAQWAFRYYDKSCDCTELRFLPDVPLIKVGDRLYVREHWWTEARWDDVAPRDLPRTAPIYPQTDPEPGCAGRFRQGMHMPRWASRITNIVTDVRVQRLQDISENDAIAEGIEDVTREVGSGDPSLRFWKRYRDGGWNGYLDTAIGSYASLWTEINGPGSWEENPWVACYTFTVHRGNIDTMPEANAA